MEFMALVLSKARFIIRRLLADKWEAAALVFATVAVLSLVAKWWAYPNEHVLAALVHDTSIVVALICSIFGLYFRPRIAIFRTGRRPSWLRETDTDIEWWPEGEEPSHGEGAVRTRT